MTPKFPYGVNGLRPHHKQNNLFQQNATENSGLLTDEPIGDVLSVGTAQRDGIWFGDFGPKHFGNRVGAGQHAVLGTRAAASAAVAGAPLVESRTIFKIPRHDPGAFAPGFPKLTGVVHMCNATGMVKKRLQPRNLPQHTGVWVL